MPTNSGGGIIGTNACASRATRAATRSPILLTGVERISIDGPPPDGNPNSARYCTGRTAHIGVWARLVCSLAGEAALGRMANGASAMASTPRAAALRVAPPCQSYLILLHLIHRRTPNFAFLFIFLLFVSSSYFSLSLFFTLSLSLLLTLIFIFSLSLSTIFTLSLSLYSLSLSLSLSLSNRYSSSPPHPHRSTHSTILTLRPPLTHFFVATTTHPSLQILTHPLLVAPLLRRRSPNLHPYPTTLTLSTLSSDDLPFTL